MSAYERSVVKFSLSNFHVTQLELATTKYAIYHRSFAATRPASPLPAFPLPICHTLSWTGTQFIIKFKYLHHFHTLMTRNLWMNTRISGDLCAVSANTHPHPLPCSLPVARLQFPLLLPGHCGGLDCHCRHCCHCCHLLSVRLTQQAWASSCSSYQRAVVMAASESAQACGYLFAWLVAAQCWNKYAEGRINLLTRFKVR